MNLEYQYLQHLKYLLVAGAKKTDRTGTGTTSALGLQMRHDLNLGLPLLTTKTVWFKGVVAELLWILSGSTNNNDLVAQGVHIWDEWAREDGSLGPIYGAQWRSWPNYRPFADGHTYEGHFYAGKPIDQMALVLDSLRRDPDGRRHIVSAWNPADLGDMALSPCHALFQFYVADGKLSCQLYQRSADWFLGVPFNVASYSLLTMMVARQLGLGLGEFVWTGGDCHLYSNHREQAAEQLSRATRRLPVLTMADAPDLFSYTPKHFTLEGYDPHPAIKAPVAV